MQPQQPATLPVAATPQTKGKCLFRGISQYVRGLVARRKAQKTSIKSKRYTRVTVKKGSYRRRSGIV